MKGFYFLATCQYLDPDLDLDIAVKMRPYGGLIRIDNSSLDLYFKSYKILRLHAILHDASGFVFEYSEKRTRLFVCPTLSSDKRVPWSSDRSCVLSVCKNF